MESSIVPETFQPYSQPSYTQEETQTQTQQDTQSASQQHGNPFPSHLWGLLVGAVAPPSASQSAGYVARPARVEMAWGLNNNECVVGRHPKSQVVLNGKKISSCHARLFVVEGEDGVRLEDQSTNGTFVRGQKVGKNNVTILESGDEVIFGPATADFAHDFRYVFQAPSSGAVTVPPNDRSGILAHYDVREQIGKGSFATVRKGIQRSTGNMVAIKIIQKARFVSNPKTMEMIQREVQIMKALDHEYCVRYIDYFEDDDRMWLVLEYVDGGDLLDYVMKRKGLNEAETREIALMVCQAVAYLHSKGVAHRDIKPENLLLTKGTRPRCLVTDFGLAKMVDNNTMLKTCCGTPSYLAPEVILNPNPSAGYGAAVDAWSIGVVLYSCLTNSTPFDESESTPLPQRMRERKVDFSHCRELGVSDLAIDFLTKLLLVDPRKRLGVQESLKHPWLTGTTSCDSDVALPPLVSSLPFNSGATAAAADGASMTAAGSLTSPAITNQDSFGYSQRLDNLRLGTPGRSFASASQTTPEKMDISAPYLTADINAARPAKHGSLGKRKEPASAFSSNSSIEAEDDDADEEHERRNGALEERRDESVDNGVLHTPQSPPTSMDVDLATSEVSELSEIEGEGQRTTRKNGNNRTPTRSPRRGGRIGGTPTAGVSAPSAGKRRSQAVAPLTAPLPLPQVVIQAPEGVTGPVTRRRAKAARLG